MGLSEFLTWLRRLRCLHLRRAWQQYEEARQQNVMKTSPIVCPEIIVMIYAIFAAGMRI